MFVKCNFFSITSWTSSPFSSIRKCHFFCHAFASFYIEQLLVQQGCSLVKSVNNEITCTCNHLTNYAVLMQVSASEVSKSNRFVLLVCLFVFCFFVGFYYYYYYYLLLLLLLFFLSLFRLTVALEFKMWSVSFLRRFDIIYDHDFSFCSVLLKF